MCVPYTGSQAWTRSLGYKVIDEWRPWRSSTNQVAGYLYMFLFCFIILLNKLKKKTNSNLINFF